MRHPVHRFLLLVLLATSARAGDCVVRNYRFHDGETMAEVRIHYVTIGIARKDNVVLILHGTGGSSKQFLNDHFAGLLFKPGGVLDSSKYFIVIPDSIGHGESSKPSDGLGRKFPHYDYTDMTDLQHRLLESLGVDHVFLVMGTSMGAMHTWMWGERWPDMMDALVPLASAPTRDDADRWLAEQIKTRMATTNSDDLLYALEASRDYDPSPDLEKIKAPLLAINSADDFVNPPELGLMEKLIRRVPRGRYLLIPTSDRTHGHGTHTWPEVWGDALAKFLRDIRGW